MPSFLRWRGFESNEKALLNWGVQPREIIREFGMRFVKGSVYVGRRGQAMRSMFYIRPARWAGEGLGVLVPHLCKKPFCGIV